jgi:hypothetical protein
VLACAARKRRLTLKIIKIADSKNFSTTGIKNALICFLSPSNYRNFFDNRLANFEKTFGKGKLI